MKKSLVCSLVTLFLLILSVAAQAALTKIGTAQIAGAGPEYNLIWQDDNNGNSLVWLDYTNDGLNWSAQNAWAAGLNLTYVLDAPYSSVNWTDSSWRLPTTSWTSGTSATGYDETESEMGHLYYVELGNQGGSSGSLENTEDFVNLTGSENDTYWSMTIASETAAYAFRMRGGYQSTHNKNNDNYGLAVRTGEISVVPVPGTLLLLGSGLLGIAGVSHRRKCTHC